MAWYSVFVLQEPLNTNQPTLNPRGGAPCSQIFLWLAAFTDIMWRGKSEFDVVSQVRMVSEEPAMLPNISTWPNHCQIFWDSHTDTDTIWPTVVKFGTLNY